MLFDKDGTLCRSDGFLSALAQARALCCAELSGEPSITEPLLMAYGLRNGQLDPSGSTAVASRHDNLISCLLYTSPSPRDRQKSRMPSSA